MNRNGWQTTIITGIILVIVGAFIAWCFAIGTADRRANERKWENFCSLYTAVHAKDPNGLDVCVKDGVIVYQERR